MELSDWFTVTFDDAWVRLQADAPERLSWEQQFRWEDIRRICFKPGDLFASDEIYIFTGQRPESYLIPIEAAGGQELWYEILHRGLFDAELAIRAATATEGIFCWPQGEG